MTILQVLMLLYVNTDMTQVKEREIMPKNVLKHN